MSGSRACGWWGRLLPGRTAVVGVLVGVTAFVHASVEVGGAAASAPAAETTEEVSASLGSEFWEAMTSGKLDGYARYRFEEVDDNQLPAIKHAYASTLRTTFGYGSRLFRNVGFYAQVENVHWLGDTLYNDGGGNGITKRAVVVDPEGTELQQALLRFRGIPRTQVLLGRQEIEHRAAPLNRYVGAIPWRQNWQSLDGVRVISDFVPALKADYSFDESKRCGSWAPIRS